MDDIILIFTKLLMMGVSMGLVIDLLLYGVSKAFGLLKL